MELVNKLHTVSLDFDKCKGCLTCMRRCPTEAIRVRNGKAKVLYDRCISCGECVRLCPHNAKKVQYDELCEIEKYKYKVALVPPTLYSQFNNLDDVNYVLNGLIKLGFDDVYEVAQSAEYVTEFTKKELRKKRTMPVISTACPAVLDLILVRYHNLMDNLLKVLAPVDVAAKLAREKAEEKSGLNKEDIGIFFISPCPAKIYALKTGIGVKKPLVDGVLSVSEIYFKLLDVMKTIETPTPMSNISIRGLRWASSGGESAGVRRDKYLACDGMENVVNVLNQVEDGKLNDLEFIELNACVGGCIGGVLNVENPFVARTKLLNLRNNFIPLKNHLSDIDKDDDFFEWQVAPELQDAYKLSDDRLEAIEKLNEIEKLYMTLPQIDCGKCGSPSCRAFAEDKVKGYVDKNYNCPQLQDQIIGNVDNESD